MAKKTNSAFMRPVHVSEALAAVVGAGPMPRTEVTKKLWDYIKKNKLQAENDKRNIVPDEKLALVFGTKEAVDMFKMTSLVSKHLTDEPKTAAR
jgi:chromatin remodeling complex protein RSC6